MRDYTSRQLCGQLRAGEYAWPGGYPVYFICADGDPISFKAVRDNLRYVLLAMRDRSFDQSWRIIGAGINWEDPYLFCAHTGERIESAYAEDEWSTR